MQSSLDSDTTRLVRVELEGGKVEEIASDDRGDLVSSAVLYDHEHTKVLAASFNFLRCEWKYVSPEVSYQPLTNGVLQGACLRT